MEKVIPVSQNLVIQLLLQYEDEVPSICNTTTNIYHISLLKNEETIKNLIDNELTQY